MRIIFIITLSILTLNIFTQNVIDSKINTVKIYMQNAEIERKASAKLYAGTQEIILTDISTQINPSSLQVQIASTGKVTLLSAKYERNFVLAKKNNPEIEKLKISLDNFNEELSWLNDQKEILKGMEDVMNKNKSFSGDAGFTPSQVSELANTYKTKLIEIRKEMIFIKKEEKNTKIERNKIQNQLNEMNAKFNKPSGNIVLLVSSLSPTTAKFKCKYIVSGAGWNPIYDLRSEALNKDVQLNYKANVYQNTGQDWNSANVIISTGNPAKNNDRPILTPLYANIYTATYKDKYYGTVNAKKATMSNMMYMEKVVVEDKLEYEQGFNYNATIQENQLSVEFQIEHKQTILSDGKLNIIPLESYKLATDYVYHTVPKLDKGAFLLAKVSDWGKYNLVSGAANIFFEGAYVGKSFLNAEITSDTMLLSMGRDESINVQRKAIKEFTETKFLGSNKKDSYAYEIIVKNKKSVGIDIEILDQIPVSQNKVISIELEEKGEAEYLKKAGKLLWKLNIPAGSNKRVSFKYTIKYPKDETISGVK